MRKMLEEGSKKDPFLSLPKGDPSRPTMECPVIAVENTFMSNTSFSRVHE
jgi:hypothetical protein